MLRGRGFTLLEVLISAVLIITGVGSIGLTVVSLRRFFKESEDRSYAMRLASSKIEEFLAKGYSVAQPSNPPPIPEGGFNWSLNISAKTATGTKNGITYRIPYKEAEAMVSYTVDRGAGGINSIKNIRLTNIIPYPQLHTLSKDMSCTDTNGCAEVPPDDKGSADPDDPDEGQYEVVQGDNRLEISFDYSVKKNIKAAYTISIRADEADDTVVSGKLDSPDTVYSTFFLDNKIIPGSIVTRTPIMSQPTFNNIEVIKDVPPGFHTLQVRWVKRTENGSGPSLNSAGKIWLVSGSLSIIATEVE